MALITFTRPSGDAALIFVDATLQETHTSAAVASEHQVENGADITDHVRPENDRLSLELCISNTPISEPQSHMDGTTGAVTEAKLIVEQRAKRRTSGPPILINPGTSPSRTREAARAVPLSAIAPLPGGVPTGLAIGIGLSTLQPGSAPEYKAQLFEDGPSSTDLGGANVLQWSGEFDRVRAVYFELIEIMKTATLCKVFTTLRAYENMALVSMSTPRTAEDGSSITCSVEFQQMRVVNTVTIEVRQAERTADKQSKARGAQHADTTEPPPQSALFKAWH